VNDSCDKNVLNSIACFQRAMIKGGMYVEICFDGSFNNTGTVDWPNQDDSGREY
jgi:hypothetical protein